MAEKNLVEEALIQIQNLEEAINENAKEILESTMKQEISELVKESMKNEAEEEEFELEDELEDESEEEDETESEEEEVEFETEDEEEEDEDSEEGFDMMDLSDMGDEEDLEVQDLSGESFDEVLKAFKEMKPTDSFEIKKEGDFIHLKDEEDEYLIQAEGEEEHEGMEQMEEYSEYNESEEEMEEIVYEIEMEEEAEEDEEFGGNMHDFKRRGGHKIGDVDGHYKDYETMEEGWSEEEEEYELEEDVVFESTKAVVGKGIKLGDAKKASTFKTSKGGFNEKKAHANPTKGTGKPKFEFKEGETFEMGSRTPKLSKEEAKEAARTYGFGSKKGRGLRKAVTPNRNLTFESREIMEELEMLRAKNEEYRKALNMFRDKLNEVAVFNSNLAYATRLFTEHSTSKQEKINILRRFDSAESLKESKALYKTIKEELHGPQTKAPMTESIERVIEKVPQSGSAVNLIESKTYENPQFLRMKDIMSKIIK
jgi:hypothetical protein